MLLNSTLVRQSSAAGRATEALARQVQAGPAASGQLTEAASGAAIPALSEVDRASAMRSYASQIARAVAQRKRYPRRARRRGDQGVVCLMAKVRRRGGMIDAQISSSSGVSSLDKAAMQAASDVGTFPAAPSDLAGLSFTFVIPIRFTLN
ncbi:MAG: energy transducer TonB [Pseudomonadota bacterium]